MVYTSLKFIFFCVCICYFHISQDRMALILTNIVVELLKVRLFESLIEIFFYQKHTPISRFEQCLLYIHIHLKPGILAEKNLELLLKPTTAKYVQDRSTNNTICWFTNEIIAKMKINPFSIVMFVAKLSKKWITWKITGKCFSKWTRWELFGR